MLRTIIALIAIVLILFPNADADAQIMTFSRENIIAYTPEWTGERFEDGRPRVPDDILERMRGVTITQAWGVLRGDGFVQQYEGGFECTQPGKVLVGRALTANYMPRRPDMWKVMMEQGKEDGRIGAHISWPIDMLVPGDVYVADTYGIVEDGPIIGDNLATAIFANSGNGVVFDGSIRDIAGVREMEGFVGFYRDWHPSYSEPKIMLVGLNAPVRIGGATVMPGDIVLGRNGSVIFIPAHLAEKVVTTSEIIRLRDRFGKQRLSEGRYTPGQIDARWTDDIESDFSGWLRAHINELPVPAETIQDYLKERTW